jgi:ribosomal protein S18 acetylase RimI-like enzyme
MSGQIATPVDPASRPVVVRTGSERDQRFLRDMLHHAYYWKERAPGDGPGPVSLYVKAFGRRGDTAVVAVSDGFPVGAAWYRVFSSEAPGYGFVDEQIPELAIGVVPSARGRGVGSALLDALTRRAVEDGRPGLSLAVDRQNHGAIALYETRGFTRVRENELTLVLCRSFA